MVAFVGWRVVELFDVFAGGKLFLDRFAQSAGALAVDDVHLAEIVQISIIDEAIHGHQRFVDGHAAQIDL